MTAEIIRRQLLRWARIATLSTALFLGRSSGNEAPPPPIAPTTTPDLQPAQVPPLEQSPISDTASEVSSDSPGTDVEMLESNDLSNYQFISAIPSEWNENPSLPEGVDRLFDVTSIGKGFPADQTVQGNLYYLSGQRKDISSVGEVEGLPGYGANLSIYPKIGINKELQVLSIVTDNATFITNEENKLDLEKGFFPSKMTVTVTGKLGSMTHTFTAHSESDSNGGTLPELFGEVFIPLRGMNPETITGSQRGPDSVAGSSVDSYQTIREVELRFVDRFGKELVFRLRK